MWRLVEWLWQRHPRWGIYAKHWREEAARAAILYVAHRLPDCTYHKLHDVLRRADELLLARGLGQTMFGGDKPLIALREPDMAWLSDMEIEYLDEAMFGPIEECEDAALD